MQTKHTLKPDLAPALQIRVYGIVQGVGFRPFVYRLARARALHGEVFNDAHGVCIRIGGARDKLDDFVRALQAEAPPLARIHRIEQEPYHGSLDEGFKVVASRPGEVRTDISPDAATCPLCLAEVLDPRDRRYRYPFTNCTHCGPRLSIVRAIPYDRQNTSMRIFPMCPHCEREYNDPGDRRFHAQPNACPACGPRVWLERADGTVLSANQLAGVDPVDTARILLQQGKIMALKGIGGFHLACDAANETAVARLRARKRRYDKPFALMARDLSVIKKYCEPALAEQALLESPEAPIVIMPADGPEKLAPSVAPNQNTYGFLLPYTPLHHLLMGTIDKPIVLTSGNASDEPQCIDNDEARKRLGAIADFLLLHDRDIVNRLDDSVARLVAERPRLLRRARGSAPAPLTLPDGFAQTPPVLALGGELKNTICLLRDGSAILSQHLGDLENPAAYSAYRQTVDLYLRLFDHTPTALAVDLHPEYLSTKLGREWTASRQLKLIEVQHHHAHVAACLAENGVPLETPPVLGVALDGLGFGADGTLWGGEFLLADYRSYRRLATFQPVPMPGGVQAIREPWRMAYAYLRQAFDWNALRQRYAHLPFIRFVLAKPLLTLDKMLAKDLNSPMTSSCGRLFDAVAAVIGLRQEVGYEGQAAIELEAAVDHDALADESNEQAYTFNVTSPSGHPRDRGVAYIESKPMWAALLRDLDAGTAPGVIAARFHKGLARAIVTMVDMLTERHGDPWHGRVALSGGVFQNALLSNTVIERLQASGREVLSHRQVPTNDGGLSLGQAAIAAAQAIK